jgi:hypothetical protein
MAHGVLPRVQVCGVMRMSVGVSNVVLENYDDLLVAVKETTRGRAFLEEFSKRHRRDETQTILDAIHKIEHVVGDASIATRMAPVLQEARQSISTIRQQIAGLGDQASPGEVPLSQRISNALKLVDDLDQRMQAPSAKIASNNPAALFARDADIFASAPAAIFTPALVPASEVPAQPKAVNFERPQVKPVAVIDNSPAPTADKDAKQGARLTITRSKPLDVKPADQPVAKAPESVSEPEIVAEVAPEPVKIEALEPAVSVVAETQPIAKQQDPTKRIVIIRRPASEAVEIPFLEEAKTEHAA